MAFRELHTHFSSSQYSSNIAYIDSNSNMFLFFFRFALLASMKASIPPVIKQSQASLNGHFDHQNEHNVMILAPNCSRFSLLPVTSSHSQRGRDKSSAKTLTASNINSKTSVTSMKERKRSKSPVARAANSFFEAMSNSWFGTKGKNSDF